MRRMPSTFIEVSISMSKQLLFLPGPVTVAQPVLEAVALPMIDHRGPGVRGNVRRVAAALRPVFGTSGEIALLGSSGTGAMEAAIVNLFSPGERVLSCPVGVFGKRFAAIAQRYGCVVESIETPLGTALDPQRLTPSTRPTRSAASRAFCSRITRPRPALQTIWPRWRRF